LRAPVKGAEVDLPATAHGGRLDAGAATLSTSSPPKRGQVANVLSRSGK
jgi:hypothetical protein